MFFCVVWVASIFHALSRIDAAPLLTKEHCIDHVGNKHAYAVSPDYCTAGQPGCTSMVGFMGSSRFGKLEMTVPSAGLYRIFTTPGVGCEDPLLIVEKNCLFAARNDDSHNTLQSEIYLTLEQGDQIIVYAGSFINSCKKDDYIYVSVDSFFSGPITCIDSTCSNTPSPSLSPNTPSPSLRPSVQSPSSNPSEQKIGSIVYGTVTCCFAGKERIIEVFANDVDVTHDVIGGMGYVDANVVSFPEPTESAAFSFRGVEDLAGKQASVMAQCVCTRKDSPWNDLKMSKSIDNWTSFFVREPDNVFAVGWNKNVFPGVQPNGVTMTTDPEYTIETLMCGSVNAAHKIKPVQVLNNPHWAVRYFVNTTSD